MHTMCAHVRKTTMTHRRSNDYSPPTPHPRRMTIGRHEEEEEEEAEEEDEEEEETGTRRHTIVEMTSGNVFSRHTNACRPRCTFVEVK